MEEGRTAGPPAGPIRTRQPSPFGAAPTPSPAEGIAICPYLAREGPDGTLGPAVPTVDPAHRCTALADAVPQSARQQELVCLTAAHANCPRFLRGRQLVEAPPVVPVRQPISPAVIIAALVFVAAIAASFGFLAVRGGFELAALDLVAVRPRGGTEPGSLRRCRRLLDRAIHAARVGSGPDARVLAARADDEPVAARRRPPRPRRRRRRGPRSRSRAATATPC